MAESKSIPEQKMGIIISYLLRTGVAASALITLTGGILYLMHWSSSPADFAAFHGEPTLLRNIPDIVTGAFAGNIRALMLLGLLVLIATPIARVLFSVFAFLLERDYLYVVITLIVLTILISSYVVL